MAQKTPKARALDLYATASSTGCAADWEAAARALAAALQPTAKVAADDLSAPVKVKWKAASKGAFVATYADGSSIRAHALWNAKGDKWRAAAQAADRLRRLRLRHGWEGSPGAPTRWGWAMMRTRVETPAWWAYVWARPLPALVTILDEASGETFEVRPASLQAA